MMLKVNTIHHSDIFDLCSQLDDASVDMILCDLPYGVIETKWDNIIPLKPMWKAFKRVIKPRGAIVLTATQPFASKLIMSNVDMFKYEWIWVKTRTGDFLRAPLKPLSAHENILVFSDANVASNNDFNMNYYPQGLKEAHIKSSESRNSHNALNKRPSWKAYIQTQTNYPKTVLHFPSVGKTCHPTQKPVTLFEYLIKTYTKQGDLVFDPCAGSGTTAIAATACNRSYIVGDSSQEYINLINNRIQNNDLATPTVIEEKYIQHSLFEVI